MRIAVKGCMQTARDEVRIFVIIWSDQVRLMKGRVLMAKPWTLTEAKAKFSSLVDRALKGEPQRVVRNGREEVVVLDAATYKTITRPKRSLVRLFSALRGVELDLDRPRTDSREAPKF